MKKMLIDDTQPEETRVVIVDGNRIEDVEFESSAKKQIKGNIFTAKVVRIEPSLQAAFVDYGGNRHGFLAFGEIHPDYYNVSDEVKAEVMREVDEIIERKRHYQAERKAEQERRRLEREQKRAEYEARQLAEAEAAVEAENTDDDEAKEGGLSVAYAENPAQDDCGAYGQDVCENKGRCCLEEDGSSGEGEHCDCGCGADCACRAEDGVCHCAEQGYCSCSEQNLSQPQDAEKTDTSSLETKTAENDEVNDSDKEEAATKPTRGRRGRPCGRKSVKVSEEEVSETVVSDEEVSETVVSEEEVFLENETVEADDEEVCVSDTEEDASLEEEETTACENTRSGRRKPRRGARFLGRRGSSRKYKVSAEAAGVYAEKVSEEVCEHTDDEFDNMDNGAAEFDNDDDEADFEHYLEVQRKLIFARKLYYRSTIQDVIKEGQTLLIQIVKEERGNKGAACTTYLSLAGRYCVLMPNRIKSGGVSRKITSAEDRKRLKDIMRELPLGDNMSLIIRTAGEDKDKEEIVRDYNYLIRTWNHIRHTALGNQAPALIYEEGNLIKRALRDMYSKDIGEVVIDGDAAYQTAKEFCKILSPNMGRKIKCRKEGELPVFQQYQVEKELDKLHNPIVQLASGGYLVINPTEALVSIDVNSGRATHEMDIEETALKTNLEAADEIAKQLRMRNLAGLVVVDFIDMEEAANNHAVEKRMREAMKPDRARVQIAKMSIFGLLEISRQRMHSSFIESNYVTCPYCKGQGVQRTMESGSALILRAVEEEGFKGVYNHLEVKMPADTAVYLLNYKRRNLSELEEKYGIEIVISADSSIKCVSDFKIDKNKVALKAKPEVVSDTSSYDEDDEEETADVPETDETAENLGENGRYKRQRFDKRRGRRRDNRRGGGNYKAKHKALEEVGSEENVSAEQISHPEAKPEAKKTTWWKKLLG